MQSKIRFDVLFVYLSFLISVVAKAACPLCTFFVGAGIGLSQWFGIDDTITGVWIGGLLISLIVCSIYWLDKKNIKFKGRNILVVFIYYFIVIAPLYYKNIIGHLLNRMWGIDKLLLGIFSGSIIFIFTVFLYEYLKKRNDNHAYFPFQKVVMPILSLIILSFVFYYLL